MGNRDPEPELLSYQPIRDSYDPNKPGDLSDGVTIRRAIKILTNEQIKALPTTPIILIPAPGVGKIILIVSVLFNIHAITDYTNVNAVFSLVTSVQSSNGINTVWNSSDSKFFVKPSSGGYSADVLWHTWPGWDQSSGQNIGDKSNSENQPAKIEALNSVDGNLTGGHANNTLKITVYYFIADL